MRGKEKWTVRRLEKKDQYNNSNKSNDYMGNRDGRGNVMVDVNGIEWEYI